MDVTPLVKAGQNIIQSYGGGAIKVSGQSYKNAVIIRPSAIQSWGVESFDALGIDDFSDFQGGEVILIGCGESIKFLPKNLRAELKTLGITVDVMDTGAACRTYNMLMSDGRDVVAALFPF